MSQIGTPLVGSYDHRLVALSIFIAISVSYLVLDLGGRVTAAHGWIRSAWLVGGATAMGLGIWSMHFTGMLAFNLPFPVAYQWPTVVLSLLVAIIASAIALYVVSRKKTDRVQALTGGVLMGLAIAGMHYIGMAAMRFSAVCRYSPVLVAVSVLIAIIASLVALVFAFDYRDDIRGTIWARVISAVVMGAAISLMHYTGMMSASFFPSTMLPDMSHAVSISSLGLSGIAIGTLVVQGAAVLTSSVDRRFAAQAQELQTSERFRQIAEILRDVLLLSNADLSEVLFVNRAYEAIWVRTTESLYADPRSWLEGVHPDDRQQVEEGVQRLVGGEPLDYLECRVVRPDGSISWVRLRGYPIVDAQGHRYRIVCTAHEFTKRKQAEEQAENRLRLVINTIPTMVWTLQPHGAVDFVNQRWLDYTGLTLEEEIEDPSGPVHPEDLPRVMEKRLVDVAAGEPSEDEMRLRRADGEYRWFLVRTAPLRDEQGNLVKWYGVSIDIEDRKQAERQSRALIDAIPQQIWSGPPDGTLDYCNDRWRSYVGLGLEELRGEGWQSMLHPDDRERVLNAWHESVTNGTPYEQEERHRGVDGTYRWFLARGVPLRDAEGRIVRWYGANTDIEDRKQAEEELRRLSGQLLRSQDEERRRIARDLHDNTGQDLVALATMLGQLRGSVPSVERKSRRLLSECKALADRCIREVRTLSYVLHPPVLDHAGLGVAIRDYVKGFIDRSGIQVELDLSPRLGRMTRDVELTLFRVVQESLTNIQRHSGSRRAEIRIHRNADIILEITDIGHGFAAKVQRGKEQPGFEVGVGIPSMQERVNLIGGRLEIDSTSQGTTVRVTIPLRRERT
jgi:PAS domain S-box-containing protein